MSGKVILSDGNRYQATLTVATNITTFTNVIQQGPAGNDADHGSLSGLADDDHTQYHNDARGDLRYSPIEHNHISSQITDSTEAGRTLLTSSSAEAQSIVIGTGRGRPSTYLSSGDLFIGDHTNDSFITYSPGANVLRSNCFVLLRTTTFKGVLIEVTSASAAGGLGMVGIYDDTGNKGPGNLITGSTITGFLGDVVGTQEIDFAAPLTLEPGVYWIAQLWSDGPVVRIVPGTAAQSVRLSSARGGTMCRYVGAPYVDGLPAVFGGTGVAGWGLLGMWLRVA